MGVVIMGYGQSKSFFWGLSEIYPFCYYFCSLIYKEEEINDLEAVVSMLSCDPLQRSNNTYIESIIVSQNQKEILAMLV